MCKHLEMKRESIEKTEKENKKEKEIKTNYHTISDLWSRQYKYYYYNHLTASFPGQPG